jgi:hypothetical protein
MRKFIDIVEAGVEAAFKSLNDFGVGSLSRSTDPTEEIEFKVFCLPDEIEALKPVMARFPNVAYTLREPTKLFQKWTLLCKATRSDGEAVSRAVKMARLPGATARID